MPKLTICANSCGQLTPNVWAIESACGALSAAVCIARTHMFKALAHEEQRVEDDGFGEGDREDRLHHDFGGRAGIPPDCDGSPLANQADTHRRAQRRQADVQTTGHRCCPFSLILRMSNFADSAFTSAFSLQNSAHPCAGCDPRAGSSWC